MAKIHLHFGQPLLDDGIDDLERWAYNQEVSIESANVNSFQTIMKVLIRGDEDGDTYFSLCFYPLFEEKLMHPRITFGYYVYKRTRYPKLIIHGDHIGGIETKKRYFITPELVDHLGKTIESDFDFEYVEHKRVGKTILKDDEVIYLLGGRPHAYRNEDFIEIKEEK
jgi:hypothetical protein